MTPTTCPSIRPRSGPVVQLIPFVTIYILDRIVYVAYNSVALISLMIGRVAEIVIPHQWRMLARDLRSSRSTNSIRQYTYVG